MLCSIDTPVDGENTAMFMNVANLEQIIIPCVKTPFDSNSISQYPIWFGDFAFC